MLYQLNNLVSRCSQPRHSSTSQYLKFFCLFTVSSIHMSKILHYKDLYPRLRTPDHNKGKESDVLQSCPTLCNPWTIARQAPPSMDFPGKNTGVVNISFSRGSSPLRDRTLVSRTAGRPSLQGRPSEPLVKSWRLTTPDHNKEDHKIRDGGEASILKCLNKRTGTVHYANQSNTVYCRFLFGKLKKQNGSLKPSASNTDTCNCEQLDSRGRKSNAQSPKCFWGWNESHITPLWKTIF